MVNLDILRSEIEKYFREMLKEHYLHNSGQKDRLEIKVIYEKFGYLFTKDLALELKDLMEKSVETDQENIRNLFSFVMLGWISEKLKDQIEALANREAELKIHFRGEDIPYRSVPVKIMNIDDSSERKELYMLKVEIDRALTDEFHIPHWRKTWEMSESFGYGAYLPTMQKLTQVDYKGFSAVMNQFIRDTEELYVETYDRFTREIIGKPLKECGYWDANCLMRGKGQDKNYPAEKLVPVMKQFFADLGFPLESVKAIILDVENRPKKVPRAFCSPVVIGKEVYINLQPVGGHKDYTTLLHEAGHAFHYAFAESDLNVDVNRLGDRAISEGFAFLFNYLPENPEWCKKYLDTEDPSGLIYNELRQKLFMLRRYGAKLAYEIELHSDNDHSGKNKIYKKNLEAALKFETPAENYMVDLDSGFYAADYLRAWIWEVQLRNYLETKYGVKWFMDKNAGKELCGLWQMAKKYPVEQLAKKIGYSGIDIDPVKNSLMNGLKR